MPKEFMTAGHMELLDVWRDDYVRRNDLVHVSHTGKQYYKSLTRTCLGFHKSKADFCDKCHDYAGVKPYCWDCHMDPKGLNVNKGL